MKHHDVNSVDLISSLLPWTQPLCVPQDTICRQLPPPSHCTTSHISSLDVRQEWWHVVACHCPHDGLMENCHISMIIDTNSWILEVSLWATIWFSKPSLVVLCLAPAWVCLCGDSDEKRLTSVRLKRIFVFNSTDYDDIHFWGFTLPAWVFWMKLNARRCQFVSSYENAKSCGRKRMRWWVTRRNGLLYCGTTVDVLHSRVHGMDSIEYQIRNWRWI